ncbi:Uu.00g063640.m01.CDS01 [Anthostomella pinea]|uniref:Uu.00g063640.m01.CDS01 n=1 Tax=Anthostomella pinea TaxID=933095 RepID=A0AAI8VU65_9PEZI|nr:Uu.00g063640.m01.CDS01 [Anthostomella pinea]
MSSFGRNFIPFCIAVVFGVANGYYAFSPYFKDQKDTLQMPIAKDTAEDANVKRAAALQPGQPPRDPPSNR